MTFAHRLDLVLREMGPPGPKITNVRFLPYQMGQYAAEATYEDGITDVVFEFDPSIASFSPQELIGLSREEARWLKDKKTDDGIGIEQPI